MGTIKKAIKIAFNLMGFEIRRASKRRLLLGSETGSADVELPENIDADVIIDVGVAGGTPWLYGHFPDAKLILVEPLNVVEDLAALIKDRDYVMYECAAGSSNGEIEINFDVERPSRSSVYERTPLTKLDHAIKKTKVEVRRIDDLIVDAGVTSAKLGLKIDTEGFELEALKGSVDTLTKCSFVVCEVSLEKRFFDSYEFSELVAWMHAKGFRVSKVLQFTVDRNDVVRMADVLFEPYSK